MQLPRFPKVTMVEGVEVISLYVGKSSESQGSVQGRGIKCPGPVQPICQKINKQSIWRRFKKAWANFFGKTFSHLTQTKNDLMIN